LRKRRNEGCFLDLEVVQEVEELDFSKAGEKCLSPDLGVLEADTPTSSKRAPQHFSIGSVPKRWPCLGGVLMALLLVATICLCAYRRGSVREDVAVQGAPGFLASRGVAGLGWMAWLTSSASSGECPIPMEALPSPVGASFSARLRRASVDEKTESVPRIVHFVLGYNEDHTTFSFINYVAVSSALRVLQPEKVMIHCLYEPSGVFWDLIKPLVTIVQGRDVQTAFGNTVEGVNHKADIIRLEALIEYGGIYIDADVVTLRPFDDIMDSDCARGTGRHYPGLVQNSPERSTFVIAAAPNATCMRRWYGQRLAHGRALLDNRTDQLADGITEKPLDAFHWPSLKGSGGLVTMSDFVDAHGQANLGGCMPTLASYIRSYVPDPLISVVMPCHKQAHFIEEALETVRAQTIPFWEIIVVDDVSPDRCAAVVSAWGKKKLRADQQSRLRVITNVENQGLSESRNTAVRAMKGLWVCALDGDDKIGPDYFRLASNAMSEQPDLQLIYSNQQFFGDSNWQWNIPEFSTATATVSGPLPVMSLYRRSVWTAVGGYSSALPWGNEDYDYWLKLLEHGVQHHKLEGAHNFYRFKQNNGMQRESEKYTKEERAMLHSRHPSLYHPAQLLEEHKLISSMADATRIRLQKLQQRHAMSSEDKAYGDFWLALSDMHRGSYETAGKLLSNALAEQALKWQPRLYLAICRCREGDIDAAVSLFGELNDMNLGLASTKAFHQIPLRCRTKAK
jgi:GT2 family glycosyltransferase